MTGVYWEQGSAKLKSYSASTKGTKSIIKIEVETDDSYELAAILRQLQHNIDEQKAVAKSKKQLTLPHIHGALPEPQKTLALTYRPGDAV